MSKNGTSFYQYVYEIVNQIPEGKVFTYGRIATALGSPRAARAVGYALRHLPPNSTVPWHRVINRLGQVPLKGRGESADTQRQRLEAEGVFFSEKDAVDLKKFLWKGPQELPRWDGETDPFKWT